jgi:hypothetical protein
MAIEAAAKTSGQTPHGEYSKLKVIELSTAALVRGIAYASDLAEMITDRVQP